MFRTIKQAYDNTNGQDITFGGGFDDFGNECASDEMYDALNIPSGSMRGTPSATSFIAQMQMALAAAVKSGIPGAQQAWQRYRNRARAPSFDFHPAFATVPRDAVDPVDQENNDEFCFPLIVKASSCMALVCL